MTEYLTYLVIAINFAAFAAFGIDKARSEAGQWRIRESTLLALALFGGLAGALAGRAVFRHKTRKKSFNTALRLVVVLNVLAVLYAVFIVELHASPLIYDTMPDFLRQAIDRP